MGGVALRGPDREGPRFREDDGLPCNDVLSLSTVPGSDGTQVWVGTCDGAALVDVEQGILQALTKKDGLPRGRVDVVAAASDGSAYLAFNAIPEKMFRNPEDARTRTKAVLVPVAPQGHPGPWIPLPSGSFRRLTLDEEGTLWAATSAGLYRLSEGVSDGDDKEGGDHFVSVSAEGTLPQVPLTSLVVDERGTVWMGVEGLEESPNQVFGFDPITSAVRILGPDKGVPQGSRIDDLLIDKKNGDLIVVMGSRFARGQVFIPFVWRWYHVSGFFIAALMFMAAGVRTWSSYKARQIRIAQHRPLIDQTSLFFQQADRTVEPIDFQTLQLSFPEGPAGKGYSTEVASCIAGREVTLEEVKEVRKRMHEICGEPPARGEEDKAAPEEKGVGYLIYPHTIDPVARRQMDMFRLKERCTIIPLPLPFIRAKLAEGSGAARKSLSDLRRKYLGAMDLFEDRNAVSEPHFFYGRAGILNEIEGALGRGESVLLFGARKGGKSSLLNQLHWRLEAFPLVHVDLQFFRRSEEGWPARLLGRIIRGYDQWGRASVPQWSPPEPGEEPLTGDSFERALAARRELQRAAGNDLPLVVLLDEAERIFPKGRESGSGEPGSSMPDRDEPTAEEHFQQETLIEVERYLKASSALRAVAQSPEDRYLVFVVADLRPLVNRVNDIEGAGGETNPFFRFFTECPLPLLGKEECAEMIRDIAGAMGLTTPQEFLDDVFAHSGGHPSLARQIASAANKVRGDEEELRSEHLDKGIRKIERESGELDTFFKENLWAIASRGEKALLRLASLGKLSADLEGTDLYNAVSERFMNDPISMEELVEGRRYLLATGMLRPDERGRLNVAIGLYSEWIRKNRQ